MNELESARRTIDSLDRQLLELLVSRMQAAEEVAAYKLEHGLPILDELREQALVEAREETASLLGLPEGTADLFRVIIGMSKRRQAQLFQQHQREQEGKPRIAAFQGIAGANSHLALVEFLGEEMECRAYETFEEVFQTVESGEALYGVVPIENSYAGSVTQVYDLLMHYEVYIIGEKSLRIDHKLMGIPGASLENIRCVASHEQAIAQCADFFKAHPQIEAKPFYNTAGAAQFVAESQDASLAALANSYAARLYGLEILAEEVNSSRDNTTRFILIGQRPYAGADTNKASVCFTLSHHPGSLAEVLVYFAAHSLNMVKIESRPLKDRKFEYIFYVDFEGKGVRAKLEEALKEDETLFADIRVLGAYKK